MTVNVRKWMDMVDNAMSQRTELINRFLDPRRDIEDECGHPRLDRLVQPDLYQQLFERDPISHRVVSLMPNECWKEPPTIYEDEDSDAKTEFETAWDDITLNMDDEPSHYNQEEGSPIWEYFRRADQQARIGRYGVMLLGFDDGEDPSQPVKFQQGRKLLFMRPLPETLATIQAFDSDKRSPRYGKPVLYSIQLNRMEDALDAVGLPTDSASIHYTRVVHLAEDLGSSAILANPVMQPVLNRLLDLRKLYGGSAEMYWRGAFPGLFFETHPEHPDMDVDDSELRAAVERFSNGLQRYMKLIGLVVKTVAPQVVDPTPQIERQIEAICIKLDIPKRIFMGSERGELASSQDADTWDSRVGGRQKCYLTPRLIVPIVNRLINVGCLPVPQNGFRVKWPEMGQLTEDEKSVIAERKTKSLALYASSGADMVMGPLDYLTRVWDMTEEEAQSVLKNAEERILEEVIKDPNDPNNPEGDEDNADGSQPFKA